MDWSPSICGWARLFSEYGVRMTCLVFTSALSHQGQIFFIVLVVPLFFHIRYGGWKRSTTEGSIAFLRRTFKNEVCLLSLGGKCLACICFQRYPCTTLVPHGQMDTTIRRIFLGGSEQKFS